MKKKLFSGKKLSKEKLKNFANKDGFYVVLFLCVTLIATSAVYITRNNMDHSLSQDNQNEVAEKVDDYESYQTEDIQPDETKETSTNNQTEKKEAEKPKKEKPNKEAATSKEENAQQTNQDNSSEKNRTTTDEVIPNATAVMSDNADTKESQENKNSASTQDTLNNFINPVDQNTITMDYSFQTTPVFSNTLNEFRSDHQGVDIAAEKGTEVKAAMDGKIVEIKKDSKLGMLITIDHSNGIQTKYGNLNSKVNVTKNQQVKKGQVIGKAGNTAMFEIDDDPHIHFEVWNGDKCVNPKEYIGLK